MYYDSVRRRHQLQSRDMMMTSVTDGQTDRQTSDDTTLTDHAVSR